MKKTIFFALSFLFFSSTLIAKTTSQTNENSPNSKNISGNNNNNSSIENNVVIIFREYEEFKESFLNETPEESKGNTEAVLKAAEKALLASVTKDNESIKNELRDDISKIGLASYQAPPQKQPFLPVLNKSQFMCNNAFRFAYTGWYDKRSNAVRFKMNSRTMEIGLGSAEYWEKDHYTLTITYLEYDKKNRKPVLYYVCSE